MTLDSEAATKEQIDQLLASSKSQRFDTPHESLDLANQALTLCSELRDYSRLAKSHHYRAIANIILGASAIATKDLSNAFEALSQTKDRKLECQIKNSQAIVFEDVGNYDASLTVHLEVLNIAEEMGDSQQKIVSHLNISTTYATLKNFDLALQHIEQGIELARELPDFQNLSRLLTNKSQLLGQLGRYEEAVELISESMKLKEKYDSRSSLINSRASLAWLHSSQGKFLEALAEYQTVREERAEINDARGVATASSSIADLLHKSGDNELAIVKSLEAMQLAKSLQFPAVQLELCATLARSHAEVGKFHEAYDNLNDYIKLQEILFGVDKQKAVAAVEVRAEIERNNAERERLKRRSLEAEQKALRAQINPHFFFNSLNSVQAFLLDNQNDDAIQFLSKFARLMRKTLDNSHHSSISLTDEIETATNYLDLEKVRCPHGFDYEVRIDPSISPDLISVPSMLLNPLLENAVWHGVMSRQDKGQIIIDVTKSDNTLELSIEDNGHGWGNSKVSRDRKGHMSFGHEYALERMRILMEKTGKNHEMKLLNAKHSPIGARVEFHLPLESVVH